MNCSLSNVQNCPANKVPRFDLMRNHIDSIRADNAKEADFLKAVYSSAYGKGFYSDYAINYAKTLI